MKAKKSTRECRSIKNLPNRELNRERITARKERKERVDKFYGEDAMVIFSMI